MWMFYVLGAIIAVNVIFGLLAFFDIFGPSDSFEAVPGSADRTTSRLGADA
jgi:hypothetical protein